MKHTPGPWHIGMRPGPIVYGSLGEQIADCRFGLDVSDEQRQNARLITAAPDMFEALASLINVVMHPESTKADMRMIATEARAAIAKATGEA